MESAQRFMLKGQLDKAIKDYQQVVALEPKEIRYRQKLAELLVKDSRKEEAIAQYADIGRHYAENSHFLKAIAVYKQIQRLSPDNLDIALTVASLNHKQGLVGNALAEYGQIVAQFEKSGAYGEAVKVVDQMLSIEPDHVATRLRHAELLFSAGDKEASLQAFRSLLNLLRGRGDAAGVQQVSERQANLFPGQQDQSLDAITDMIAAGALDDAVASLQEWLKRDSRDMQAWRLLCDAHNRKGNHAGRRAAFARMMEIFQGDLGVVKGAVRCEIDAGDYSGALALLERHLPLFVERGESAAAEELLKLFPAEVAEKLKATEWLTRFCDASGAGENGGQSELETPSAFDLPPVEESQGAVEPPGAFDTSWLQESSAPEEDQPQGWEEEIQLDLDDDDFESHLPQTGHLPLPDNLVALDLATSAEGDLSPFEEQSPFEEEASPTAEPAAPGTEAPSLNDLSFLAEEPAPAEVDAGADLEECPLELALPDDPEGFPGLDWAEEPGDTAEDAELAQQEGTQGLDLTDAMALEEPEHEEVVEEVEHLDLLEHAEDVEVAEEAEHVEVMEEVEEHLEDEEPQQVRGWDEIYPDPETGEAPVDPDDLESHYDLGIGYKEMGMYDGAIRELDIAARNPQRRLACLTLQAMCYREKGETEKARDLLQRGLELNVLSAEERNTLSYELAVLLEGTGAVEEAVNLYRQVHKVNPVFHDVADKLYRLTGEEPLDFIDLETVDAEV